jgi:hypothetical protein
MFAHVSSVLIEVSLNEMQKSVINFYEPEKEKNILLKAEKHQKALISLMKRKMFISLSLLSRQKIVKETLH